MAKEDIFGKIYTGEHTPEQLDLNDFFLYDDEEKVRQSVDSKIDEASKANTTLIGKDSDIPRPLTKKEAEEMDKRIQQLQAKIAYQRQRIKDIGEDIDSQVSSEPGKEIQFSVNVSKRPILKKAIKSVFGFKTNTITYSTYKAALELKSQLEREEAQSYLSGEE